MSKPTFIACKTDDDENMLINVNKLKAIVEAEHGTNVLFDDDEEWQKTNLYYSEWLYHLGNLVHNIK